MYSSQSINLCVLSQRDGIYQDGKIISLHCLCKRSTKSQWSQLSSITYSACISVAALPQKLKHLAPSHVKTESLVWPTACEPDARVSLPAGAPKTRQEPWTGHLPLQLKESHLADAGHPAEWTDHHPSVGPLFAAIREHYQVQGWWAHNSCYCSARMVTQKHHSLACPEVPASRVICMDGKEMKVCGSSHPGQHTKYGSHYIPWPRYSTQFQVNG